MLYNICEFLKGKVSVSNDRIELIGAKQDGGAVSLNGGYFYQREYLETINQEQMSFGSTWTHSAPLSYYPHPTESHK